MNDLYTMIDSPLGSLLAIGHAGALTRLHFASGQRPAVAGARRCDDAFAALRAELGEYFEGERRSFSMPLAPAGRPFEQRVWAALMEIPYGTRATYGEIARRVGTPGSARAVGAANGRNPIAILVPCHRVVGADGKLTGYAAGLERKRRLLELEAGAPALPIAAAS
jgi:methylated-DNA-[protein]-cysteine S-methyltransferase